MNKNYYALFQKTLLVLFVSSLATASLAQCDFETPQANDASETMCENSTTSGNLSSYVVSPADKSNLRYSLVSATGDVSLSSNGDFTLTSGTSGETLELTARIYSEASSLCSEYESFPCDKQLQELDIIYLGADASIITIVGNKGDQIGKFENVKTNDHLNLNSSWLSNPGSRNNWLVYVDGNLNTEIHTSCSEDIFGHTFGDFYIYAGADGKGNIQQPTTSSHTEITLTVTTSECVNTVSGTIYKDLDKNGSFGFRELGIEGVTVYVFNDLNFNGELDSDETNPIATSLTNALGQYNVGVNFSGSVNICYLVGVNDPESGYNLYESSVCFNETGQEVDRIDIASELTGKRVTTNTPDAPAEVELQFSVSPNPAKTQTKIVALDKNVSVESVSISDGFGIDVTNQVKIQKGKNSIGLNLSSLRNGSYIVEILSNNSVERHTLQVSR